MRNPNRHSPRSGLSRGLLLSALIAALTVLALVEFDRRKPSAPRPHGAEDDLSAQAAGVIDASSKSVEERRPVSMGRADPTAEAERRDAGSTLKEDSHPTFGVAGNILAPADLPPGEQLHLRIRESIGSGWKDVAGLDVQLGDWGPIEVPYGETPFFLARLEGQQIIPQEQVFEAPAPGDWVRLSFEAAAGTAQWYLVTDAEESPLAGATVRVLWRSGSRWIERSATTDETGYCCVIGIRPGAVVARASREGYVPVRLHEHILPPPEPETYVLPMPRASILRGRCTHRGEPVRDFSVAFWSVQKSESSATKVDFVGREDGTFEVGEVPLGEVRLAAASATAPGSEVVTVLVPDLGDEIVELELLDGGLGTGRVVDEESGEPLADASVQCFVRGTTSAVMHWGPPRRVRPDGSFGIEGFLSGRNWVEVTAPGYATRQVTGSGATGGEVAFGTIRLPLSRELTVRLPGVAPDTCEDYRVTAKGSGPVEASNFEMAPSGDALAVMLDVSPGTYRLLLHRPDYSMEAVWIDVGPEGSWQHAFRASGGGTLRVEVEGDAPPRPLCAIHFHGANGQRHSRSGWVEDGSTIELMHVEPGLVHVEIQDGSDHVLARRSVSVAAGAVTDVLLDVADESIRLTVVDGDGNGLAGVQVRMRPRGDSTAGTIVQTTGADGAADLGPLDPGSYLVHLDHGERGMRLNVPVEISSEEDELELVLEADGALDLQFLDGDVPVPSTTFHLADVEGSELTGAPYHADDTGRAILEPIAPCRLRLSMFDDRLWHVEPEVDVGTGTTPHAIQVRRLGDLRVEVRNGDGLPVSGVLVELTSTEFQAAVSDWIGVSRVGCSPEDSRTDNLGRIRLRGLPNGAYAWRVPLVGGQELAGSVSVKAEAESLLLISVP